MRVNRLICFGDSLTAGWNGSRVTPRLTARLEQGLHCRVFNAGVPGETTRQALLRLKKDVLRPKKNQVIIFFGSNDASFHKGIPLAEFKENLLTICRNTAPIPVLLITPPPVIEARQIGKRVNERITLYVSAVKQVAGRLQLPVADFNQLLGAERDLSPYLLSDGLHLTDKGYDLLAGLIISSLNEKLNK